MNAGLDYQAGCSGFVQHAVKEPLWNYLAEQYGYPTQQQLIAHTPFGLTNAEWLRAWDYAESTSLDVPIRTGYVPIPKTERAPCPVSSLY